MPYTEPNTPSANQKKESSVNIPPRLPIDIELVNEYALTLRIRECDIEVAASTVQRLVHKLESQFASEIVDLIPAYNTLTAIINPTCSSIFEFKLHIESLLNSLENLSSESAADSATDSAAAKNKAVENHKPTRHRLPVYYGNELAWDLARMAKSKGLTEESLIKLHHQKTYNVYALGFSPGFPYLGMVDEKLCTPRLSSPRVIVPRGAVGIAEQQTGIYPSASPGGWNIIGNCPIPLFDIQANKNKPTELQVGDEVIFYAISHEEFIAMGGEIVERSD